MKNIFSNPIIRKQMLKSCRIAATISSFIGVFVVLIPFENWWINATIIGSLFFIIFFLIFVFLLAKKKRIIGKCNNISISAMYGDILNIKINNNKPVIVIPVNSTFDYIVEDCLDVNNPIVSNRTIHGKWVLKMTNNEKDKLEQLEKDIEKGIISSELIVEKNMPNKRGNKKQYKLGSSIFIEKEDCAYMLFALTDFDEKNHVIERNIRTYSDLINDFVNATSRCQGRDIYVPIMGVGLSLFGLNHKQAFEIMKASIINQKNMLKSSINIVIFNDDKDKISIYD